MAGQKSVPVLLIVLLTLPFLSFSGVAPQTDEPLWRSVGLDPELWTDRPVAEDSPMMPSYTGNAVIEMKVSYVETHLADREEGTIIIELFEQWAPITTENMIQHVESGLYDGIFFHRVIDDFVTQSGDPECKEIGIYPATSLQCGSGGTGETIPLEHDENLSHVDGAIGMARSADPDSADSQWYIAETEAHGLDPENREDDGYATFGIVRDGMSHIRAIARTPTSDDMTGIEEFQNPASTAGRPLYQAKILSMEMIGVADPDGLIRFGDQTEPTEDGFFQTLLETTVGIGVILAVVVVGVLAFLGRIDPPLSIDKQFILDAELEDVEI